jgi:hypothetical protein
VVQTWPWFKSWFPWSSYLVIILYHYLVIIYIYQILYFINPSQKKKRKLNYIA